MTILVVMGVSGSGKTTVASMLAQRLEWPFQEGDDLHPPANIAKMRQGIPLTDADRVPWLQRISDWIGRQMAAGENGIVTCSALKKRYRDMIVGGRPDIVLVYLSGTIDELRGRLAHRQGHFMPRSLLASQFDDLQPPVREENAIMIPASLSPDAVCAEITAVLQNQCRSDSRALGHPEPADRRQAADR